MQELEPLDDFEAYIPLDSKEGESIVSNCAIIKENRPLRTAPVVPSQNIPVPADINRYETSQPSQQPAQLDQDTSFDLPSAKQCNPSGVLGSSQDQPMEEAIGSSEAGPSSHAQRERRPKSKEVLLRQRQNSPGYKFEWKGRQVKTERHEWTKEGNALKLREPFHGYIFWGYHPI